jgi:hypothetical protein
MLEAEVDRRPHGAALSGWERKRTGTNGDERTPGAAVLPHSCTTGMIPVPVQDGRWMVQLLTTLFAIDKAEHHVRQIRNQQ